MEFLATLSPSREVRLTSFQTILLRRVAMEGRVELASAEGLEAANGLERMGLVVLDRQFMTPTADGERALALLLLGGIDIPVLDISDLEE